MYGAIGGIWGRSVGNALRDLWLGGASRVGLVGVAVLLTAAVSAATVRVVGGAGRTGPAAFEIVDADVPDTYPRLDRPAPDIGLVDQTGAKVDLERFEGRPMLVTFAFAHCSTICPLLVRDALRVQRALADAGVQVAVVVITLDPWRDQPSRLLSIADKWGLGSDAFVVSGEIEKVHEVLAAWNVPWQRDERTGDIVHPRLTYIVDGSSTIAYAASGGVDQVRELTRRATES